MLVAKSEAEIRLEKEMGDAGEKIIKLLSKLNDETVAITVQATILACVCRASDNSVIAARQALVVFNSVFTGKADK